MIAAYLRVSTYDQNNASQRAAIERWAESNGLSDQLVWYEDTGTGKNLERPAFERMRADLFAGEVSAVAVYKLDRLSRDVKDGVNLLLEWIENDIRIVSVTQQMDFSGSTGKMIGMMLLSLAEIEHEFIRERQAAGIEIAKQKGAYRGRTSGSVNRKAGIADPVAKVGELWEKGNTIADICRTVKLAPNTAKKYLRLSMQAGKLSRHYPETP